MFSDQEREDRRGIDKLIILNSQQVRADLKGMPADINVLGVNRTLEAGKDLDETRMKARGEGGIVLACSPVDRCGMGFAKVEKLLFYDQIDGIEAQATSPRSMNAELYDFMGHTGKKAVTVSNSHHYKEAGTSHILLDDDVTSGFSIDKLRKAIVNSQFDQHSGEIGLISRLWNRDRHIAASIPGHLLRNPQWIINVLKKRK